MLKRIMLFLLLLTLACGSASTATKVGEVSEDAPATVETVAPASYGPGDIIQLGDVQLIVYGWRELEPDGFFQPDNDKRFVAVDVAITNTSQSSISISSLLQMSIKDEEGRRFPADFGATSMLESSVSGEFAPGELTRGEVGFHIPKTSTVSEFIFDADLLGTGKAFVSL